MAATGSCSRVLADVPFLEGTVPPADNVHGNGCLNLEQYVEQAVPDRPQQWVEAADTWSDRLVNGQTGSSGDPATYHDNPNVRFAIAPIPGESGFPSICGEVVAPPPTPAPTPPPEGGPPSTPPGQEPPPAPTPPPGNGGGPPGGGAGG
jgi:hypothetical protein